MAQLCPFCQNPVDDGTYQCPHCGRVQYKIRCSRCGGWSFANSSTCRSCNGPFTSEDQARRFMIEANDPFMRDIAPTMAPIPRRPGAQAAPPAQPAPPPAQPQAPPVVVVQPQAPAQQPYAPQPQVVMVDRGRYREKSYLGEAFITLALYYFGLFVAGLVANLIFLGNARRDRREGVNTRNVGCLQALLWVHIIGLIISCIVTFAMGGLSFLAALIGWSS
jgi:hypothetical protein